MKKIAVWAKYIIVVSSISRVDKGYKAQNSLWIIQKSRLHKEHRGLVEKCY